METDYPGAEGIPSVLRSYNSQAPIDTGLGVGWSSSLAGKHLTLRTTQYPSTPVVQFVIVNGTTQILVTWLPGALLTTVEVVSGTGRNEVFTCNNNNVCSGSADTHLTLTADPSGYTLTQNQSGLTERYDTNGNLTSETSRAGQTTTYTYNAGGQLSTVTGPFGHTLTLAYNSTGRLGSVTDPTGLTTSYAYNATGNLTQVTYPDATGKRYHYENTNFPHHLTGISFVESGGAITRYATYGYDTTGRAILTEHAGGLERFTLTYDTATQTTVTDAAGTREAMTFQELLGLKNLAWKVNQDGKSLNQTFDVQNNVLCKKDEEGRVTTSTYNNTNQKTSMTEGLSGSCAAPQTTSATRTTSYSYLSATLDLPTLIQSPSVYSGSFKRTEIGYQGNLPSTITQRGYTPSGSAVARTVALSYDSAGHVTSIDGPRTDVNDLTTLNYYTCTTGGACGQLKTLTNALNQVTTFDSYDGNARLLQQTDANGLRTSYAYDARGRVIGITQTPPAGSARLTGYAYTAAGDVAQVTFPDGRTLSYAYSAARKLLQITDNLGNQIRYGYDLKGNRTQEYTYDPSNTLVKQIDLAFDARNYLASVNTAGSLTQQLHDAVGNLTQQTDPNNNPPTTNSYDALNRLLQTINALGGSTTYGYHVNDKLAQIQAPNGATTQYQYDDLGNLLQETSPDRGTTAYSYDSAGNLLSQTDARGITTAYRYDALNRLTAIPIRQRART